MRVHIRERERERKKRMDEDICENVETMNE